MRILGVGIATLDVVNQVAAYPAEDEEVRALAQHHARGGNATNNLVVLSQLGHDCSWAGTLADDAASDLIRTDLHAHRVNLQHVIDCAAAVTPTSYVTLNQHNGSRTIVHYRQLAEYTADDFSAVDPLQFDWIHFEGRNVPDLRAMMMRLRDLGVKHFSLEVEKPREAIETLFTLPSLLMFSRAYVRDSHQGSVKDFFTHLCDSGVEAPMYCGWGAAGGWAMSTSGALLQQPAWEPAQVIDTLGAGDVFNATVIDGHLRQLPVEQVLENACLLAGTKCGQPGLDNLNGVLNA